MFEENGPELLTMHSPQIEVAVTSATEWRPGFGVVRGRKINKTAAGRLNGPEMWCVNIASGRPVATWNYPKLVLRAAQQAWDRQRVRM